MLKYIAILWRAGDPDQSAASNLISLRARGSSVQWQRVLDAPGITVFASITAGSGPYGIRLLKDGAGVVIGSVFQRNSDLLDESVCSTAAFGTAETANIIATSGRRLIEAYWGSYIAFLRDARLETRWILRSPVNAPLCLHASFRGANIYCSAMEDLLQLKLLSFSVNWGYVATYAALAVHRPHETGLNEVTEVELGECLEFANERCSRTLYWRPGELAKATTLEDSNQAAAALRATTRSCVHTLASYHDSILLKLSGGVDSSIMLACLSDTPTKPRLAALHRYWPGPLADERHFARSAARQAQCELIELERSPECRLDSVYAARPTARPHTFAFLEQMRMEIDIATQRNASALFCGTLGDAVFHHAPAMPAAAEYLSKHGLNPTFISVALDVAELEHASLWRVLRRAFNDWLFDAPKSYWSPEDPVSIFAKDSMLVRDDVLPALDLERSKLTHLWLHQVRGVPSGKLWQIRWLPFDGYWRNPYSQPGDPARVAAFASQPIVELGLQIPTYLNVTNGWDRAVARLAFSQDLPETIHRRRTKGSPDAWVRNVIASNGEFIRETLLDGILVRRKLLDARKIEEAMPGSPSKTQSVVGSIVQHLCTETWVRNWTGIQAAGASL